MARARIAVMTLLTVLAGCGTGAHTLPHESERVPVTQRAIAAIMLEHLPEDTSSREATYTDEEDEPGTVGADLRYGGGGESDGELVRAVLEPGTREEPCEERCVELDTEVEGATLTLHWDEIAPEEDPGVIAVALQREGELAYVVQAGPAVTGDPRELDLDITVDDMVAVAEDPWLRLRTSPEAVAAGEELEDWEGGEPDPTAYERVPNTDLGMLAAYEGFGFGGRFDDLRSSPLKAALGPGAIGGRMTRLRDGRQAAVVLDVLAAPDPDAWQGDDPCSTWEGGCVEQRGGRGRVFLAWRPTAAGDPGVVWAATIREDEVIAIRMSGPQVPRSRDDVVVDVEWYLLAEFLGEGDTVGMETIRQVVDRGEELATR